MRDTSDPSRTNRRRVNPAAIVLLASALLLLAAPALANPPSDMTISYDPGTAKIMVTITHPVDDPATHYLKTVRVKLNDRVISDPEYKSQTSKNGFTSTYDVNANPGDTIRVTAICVLGGTLEKTYDVPRAVSPAAPAGSSAPAAPAASPLPAAVPPTTAKAAAGLLPLLGAAVAVLGLKKDVL